jgi:hypothetical protein
MFVHWLTHFCNEVNTLTMQQLRQHPMFQFSIVYQVLIFLLAKCIKKTHLFSIKIKICSRDILLAAWPDFRDAPRQNAAVDLAFPAWSLQNIIN